MYNQPMFYPTPMMQNPQQRLQVLEAQYPQFSQPGYIQPVQQHNVIKGRPVANEEEANAAMIDFDGSLFVFPDKAHGKIYTKQLGMDGNIVFLRYVLEQQVPMQNPNIIQEQPQAFVTVDAFNKTIDEVYKKLSDLKGPDKPLNKTKEA